MLHVVPIKGVQFSRYYRREGQIVFDILASDEQQTVRLTMPGRRPDDFGEWDAGKVTRTEADI